MLRGLEAIGTQYKATVRQIVLLFPHDTSPDAAKGPDNKGARPDANLYRPRIKCSGQAFPENTTDAKTARHCLAVLRELLPCRGYLAAVGSGTGLSASVCR